MKENDVLEAFESLLIELNDMLEDINEEAQYLMKEKKYNKVERSLKRAKKIKQFLDRIVKQQRQFKSFFLQESRNVKRTGKKNFNPNSGKSTPSKNYDMPGDSDEIIELDPEHPEDLTHTTVVQCSFAGRESKNNWNALLRTAHKYALEKYGSFEVLNNRTISNMEEGKTVGRGFTYIYENNISIQNDNANHCLKSVLNLARDLGVNVEVEFYWRNKEAAAYAGARGKISF